MLRERNNYFLLVNMYYENYIIYILLNILLNFTLQLLNAAKLVPRERS